MNKIRLIGILLVAAGIAARFLFENSDYSVLFALVIGIGIGLLITGKFGRYGKEA